MSVRAYPSLMLQRICPILVGCLRGDLSEREREREKDPEIAQEEDFLLADNGKRVDQTRWTNNERKTKREREERRTHRKKPKRCGRCGVIVLDSLNWRGISLFSKRIFALGFPLIEFHAADFPRFHIVPRMSAMCALKKKEDIFRIFPACTPRRDNKNLVISLRMKIHDISRNFRHFPESPKAFHDAVIQTFLVTRVLLQQFKTIIGQTLYVYVYIRSLSPAPVRERPDRTQHSTQRSLKYDSDKFLRNENLGEAVKLCGRITKGSLSPSLSM